MGKNQSVQLSIRIPEVSLFSSFENFREDMRAHGETLWDGYYPAVGESAEDFILRIQQRTILLEGSHLVPETIYWGVVNGEVVGRISLRHHLAGNLFKIGGHIGYEVGPSYRRRGFATEMLKQILLTPKAKEIGKLLLTCSPKNPASNQTILTNGGVLEKTIFVDLVNEDRNHYWISLFSNA